MRWLWGLGEVIQVKSLMECLSHRKTSIRVLSYQRWLLGSAGPRCVPVSGSCHGSKGHCLWMGAPPVLCKAHPYVPYRNDLSGQYPPPAVPLHPGHPSPASAGVSTVDRVRSSPDFDSPPWSQLPPSGRESRHSIAPGQVHLLLQLSKPGSLGAGGGASSTFSMAASEYFEFH